VSRRRGGTTTPGLRRGAGADLEDGVRRPDLVRRGSTEFIGHNHEPPPSLLEGSAGGQQLTNVITPVGSVVDDQGANYWVAPWEVQPSTPVPRTRTLEFNTDGTMTFFKSPSGSACVTVDTLPRTCKTF
jgi:hypothetical protein